MTTFEDIKWLLNNAEKETLTVELKRSAKLKDPKGLAFEIVALANRRGGKLILGIDDDGKLEGKSIFDIDATKRIIDDICYIKISPIINYRLEYLEKGEGDIVVVNIPKRGEIPHAFINSKEGNEIKNRIYYIRTQYGKKLVSDNQLLWLFNYREDADFVRRLRTAVTYRKKDFRIFLTEFEQLPCVDYFHAVTDNLASRIARSPSYTHDVMDKEKTNLLIDLAPYVLIYSLSNYFNGSWVCEINQSLPVRNRQEVRYSSFAGGKVVDNQKVTYEQIQPPYGSILSNLQLELVRNSISARENPSFCVPPETKIKISTERSTSILNKTSKLLLENSNFNFEFVFERPQITAGPAHGHPIWETIVAESRFLSSINEHELYQNYQSIEFDVTFKAKFSFPEKDVDMFDYYYKYAKNIEDILCNDWDYDHFLKNLPNRKFYSLDSKLDTILRILNDNAE